MKTKSSARRIVRIRDIMLAVGMAAIFGLEVYLGASLAARNGHTTTQQKDDSTIPNASISELMIVAPLPSAQ
jgi:hypothetical protein